MKLIGPRSRACANARATTYQRSARAGRHLHGRTGRRKEEYLNKVACYDAQFGDICRAFRSGNDDRFAATVCDGGIWDLHERAFLVGRNAPIEPELLHRGFSRVARNIKCPVLISRGERGRLKADRVRELYDHLQADSRDVTLKIVTGAKPVAISRTRSAGGRGPEVAGRGASSKR